MAGSRGGNALVTTARSLGLGALLCAFTGCYAGVQEHGQDDVADGGPGQSGGNGDADGDDGAEPLACDGQTAVVAPRAMRRLTPTQYENTMRELLGDPGFVAEYDATALVIEERGVRQLRDGAELALDRRDQWTASVFPCDIDNDNDDACADTFIDTFAPRAFRRPLQDSEREWLSGVYLDARAQLDFHDSMEVLAAAVLQAPPMIYMEELGTAVEGAPDDIRKLTDHELANRLSYFLWDTMPDDVLREIANAGALHGEQELQSQVERMLQDPRAEARLQQLMWNWLQLDGGQLHFSLEDAQKQEELYPEYDPALQDAMRVELEAFVADVLSGDASFDQLMTSNRAYVNGPLADLYGVDASGLGPDEWAWVDLPAEQRSGILTRAAFLTVFSNTATQAPIRRGTFTLEEVLCFDIGAPPPDVDDSPIEGGEQPGGGEGDPEVLSVREATDARTEGDLCSSCHNIINPVGYTFEHYDAIGRWQDDEVLSGMPVDSSAELVGVGIEGTVNDAVELSTHLASSERARSCFATRWFEEALGGGVGELDSCAHDRITESFVADGDLRQLVSAIVRSDSFRHINLGPIEQGE